MNIPLLILEYSLALLVAALCLLVIFWLICVFVKWLKEGCPLG